MENVEFRCALRACCFNDISIKYFQDFAVFPAADGEDSKKKNKKHLIDETLQR